ncbi:pentapeptide repeat-containing protein [Methylobacterium sp.]|uniref:pentapeptide repeat-containing protein n=1 Tax=Methylobacterium sp. TaxID=409 RepID=UPI003459A447
MPDSMASRIACSSWGCGAGCGLSGWRALRPVGPGPPGRRADHRGRCRARQEPRLATLRWAVLRRAVLRRAVLRRAVLRRAPRAHPTRAAALPDTVGAASRTGYRRRGRARACRDWPTTVSTPCSRSEMLRAGRAPGAARRPTLRHAGPDRGRKVRHNFGMSAPFIPRTSALTADIRSASILNDADASVLRFFDW